MLTQLNLNPDSIELAKRFADDRGLANKTQFLQRDAWNLQMDNSFDRVVSLGLNIYSPTIEVAINLYKSFYRTLKEDGQLLVSYMSPLPTSPDCEMDLSQRGPIDTKLMPLIAEILQQKFFNHLNTTAQIVENLTSAGFKSVSCHHTSYRALNIAVAVK